jgi:hypothetical protein
MNSLSGREGITAVSCIFQLLSDDYRVKVQYLQTQLLYDRSFYRGNEVVFYHKAYNNNSLMKIRIYYPVC